MYDDRDGDELVRSSTDLSSKFDLTAVDGRAAAREALRIRAAEEPPSTLERYMTIVGGSCFGAVLIAGTIWVIAYILANLPH